MPCLRRRRCTRFRVYRAVRVSNVTLPELSRSGLGTGPFSRHPQSAQGTAEAAVDTALRLGVRHFDTAPFYGLGQAERWLGAALSGRPRDSFVVSTKVGRSPV